ncbi:cytochrome c [Ramlibacter sp.]|uniref:c-type cytochrome n=1 Tax=Ramlibacter sp. TaxID=1917967 RepID=UPI0035AE351D
MNRSPCSPWTVLARRAALGLALVASAGAQAQADPSVERGRLLYANHCVECHNREIHWREQRRAADWESLRVQVRRWQGEARLGWSDDDIEAVTRHLNDSVYRFPRTQARAR